MYIEVEERILRIKNTILESFGKITANFIDGHILLPLFLKFLLTCKNDDSGY